MKNNISFLLFGFLLLAFWACESNSDLTKKQKDEYLKKGQTIAMQTFGVLGGQLQKAMKKGGVKEAISYCNLAAYPLVDSLSEVYNAQIKRTSLKIRNPKNSPSAAEEKILKRYHSQMIAGKKLQPILEQEGNTLAFYAPIKLNDLCLKCHGQKGETLLEESFATLQEFYPEDKATGYKSGDLRGIWSIKFPVD